MPRRSVLVATIAPILLTAPALGQDLSLQNGDLRFVLSAGGNVKLFVHGIPVIRESHLYIVKPGWTGPLMNQDQVPGKTTATDENGVKIGLAEYETDKAWSKHRYEVHPDNTFRVTVTYGVKGDQPGEVEYAAAYLNGNVLHGAPFTAETVEGTRSGVTPMYAKSEDQKESLLCPLLKKIHFDTRIGPIDIAVEGSDESIRAFRLFDARGGRQDWASNNPVFWFGMGAPALPVNGEQTVTVTYRFGKPEPRPAAPAVTVRQMERLAAARVPYVPDLPVIPRPKEAKFPEDTAAPITPDARIVIPDAPCDEEKAAARELQAELKHFWGLSVPIRRAKQELQDRRTSRVSLAYTTILLRRDGEETTRALLDRFPPAPRQPEGYGLVVNGCNVAVNGHDGRGVYYGAQTLKQLIRLSNDKLYLKGARVRDWPTLPMRGVHWFGGPKSLPFHKAMIDRIVSGLKMNTMLYQADFTKWESQPNLWGDGRMTEKRDVKAAIDYGRAHFIEPIPLVQGLGHSDWMFANRQNRHLACDPEKVYSFNPFLPEAYEKQFTVWQEAIDLFQPIRYFHIGHDEITTGGGFPPKGTTKSNTEIIVEDIKKDHAWLRERGLKTMMWGDELLHWPEEASDAGNATMEDARIRREALPKDIVITDWHYAGDTDRFPSAKILQDAGYGVVGVTWFQWPNIQNFSRVLAKEKSMGLIQSTWAGYTMSQEIVDTAAFNQFVAYLVAAENAWNGGRPGTESLGYNPDEAFRYFWSRKPVDRKRYPGLALITGEASNAAMWDWLRRYDSPDVKPGQGVDPEGRYTVQGKALQVGRPVWLAGALNPAGVWPEALEIPLNGTTVSELQFIWGATEQAEAGLPVARLTVTYEDGQSQETTLRYATEVFAFHDVRGGAQTAIAWTGKTPLGTPAAVRSWSWKNPRPAARLKAATVTSLKTEAAPVVLGMTAVSPRN